jgi:hypothetical protein
VGRDEADWRGVLGLITAAWLVIAIVAAAAEVVLGGRYWTGPAMLLALSAGITTGLASTWPRRGEDT